MSKEDSLNKTLYKTELVFLKILLPIMAFSYLLNSLACYFSVGVQVVTHYLGLVVAPMAFLLISSKVFKFCFYHRLFIYYVLADELLLITDWYFKIPISNKAICHVHFGIAVLFFSLAVGIFIYKKFKGNIKICKYDETDKKSISRYNR